MLEKQGIHRNPGTILCIMEKYGLLAEIRRHRKWVNMGQQVYNLSTVRDLYDNSIVVYKTGTEQTVNLVLDTIRLAMRNEKKRAAAELQIHSD